MQNFTEIVKVLFRGLNARGVAKYSDVGHVEGYISETVQDTASGTIENHTRKIQWYHLGPSRVTNNKGFGPFTSLK